VTVVNSQLFITIVFLTPRQHCKEEEHRCCKEEQEKEQCRRHIKEGQQTKPQK
jgi:hypothetical protein